MKNKQHPLLKYNSGFMPMGATLDVAASFATLLGMPGVDSLSDAQLAAGIQTATLAKSKGIPQASEALIKLQQEQARRKASYGGSDNTKLYLLLGGAGLAAAWFFFIRKK